MKNKRYRIFKTVRVRAGQQRRRKLAAKRIAQDNRFTNLNIPLENTI